MGSNLETIRLYVQFTDHEAWLARFQARCDRARSDAVRDIRVAFAFAFLRDGLRERLIELGAYVEVDGGGTLFVSPTAYRLAEPYMYYALRHTRGAS